MHSLQDVHDMRTRKGVTVSPRLSVPMLQLKATGRILMKFDKGVTLLEAI
jgi:hypothetical protein